MKGLYIYKLFFIINLKNKNRNENKNSNININKFCIFYKKIKINKYNFK